MVGMSHLAVTCKNMEKSLDFYINALGFKKAFDIPRPQKGEPWILYLHMAGRQFIELFYNADKDNAWKGGMSGFNHVCFEVEDINEIAEKIKKAGYEIASGPKRGGDGNWQLWVIDPDGLRIELMQIDAESIQGRAIAAAKSDQLPL